MELSDYQASKVASLADIISQGISMKQYHEGDFLPSINQLSTKYKVSRDTVFKAFINLKERGLIDSMPGKGYFVINQVTKVLLLLDQYSPFKEALYNSFIKKLNYQYKVDLLFHQYNEQLFNTIIRESIGKYSKYIVMNFNNEQFHKALLKIPANRLLIFDFGKFKKEKYAFICQDFDVSFYQALEKLENRLKKYQKLIFLFPKDLKHPQSSKTYFKRFCDDKHIPYHIQENVEVWNIEANTAYIAIKQQDVVKVIKEGKNKGWKCGKDFGLLAYNDIPSYEVIDEGITALSINWEQAGNEIAQFVLNNTFIQKYLHTKIILRKSL